MSKHKTPNLKLKHLKNINVEVDQSGKFEATNLNTIVAFANGHRYSVMISAQTKRFCIRKLREEGLTGSTYYLQLFTILLFFLLKNHIDKISQVLIDKEYTGKEKLIKEYLLNLFYREGKKVDSSKIRFGYVGKHSPAHIIALETLRGKKRADITLSATKILSMFRHKKNRGPLYGGIPSDVRPVKDKSS